MRLYGHVIGLDEVRAMREIDKALGRHPARATKKARANGPDVVAPTGIESVRAWSTLVDDGQNAA